MNVIYFLRTEKECIVPFYGYDPVLFSRFIRHGFHNWNRERKQFVLPRALSNQQKSALSGGLPFIELGANGAPLVAGNFFKDIWIASAPPEPNSFPENFERNLKTELHARKYSDKTLKAYVLYNRSLCRFAQKPPDKITADDIKRYLAYLNRLVHKPGWFPLKSRNFA
jgi:hypothetical protein